MKPLFNQTDIFGVIEYQKRELKSAFRSVTNSELDEDSVALAARLIEQFSLSVPVLDEEKKYALTKETQVDVSRDPRRFISNRSQPFYIAGTEVRIVVPFEGDPGMFRVQPTTFNLNPPIGEVRGNELHLAYQLTDANFDVEGAASRTLGEVKQYLQSLRGSAEQLKNELQQLVNAMIEQARRNEEHIPRSSPA